MTLAAPSHSAPRAAEKVLCEHCRLPVPAGLIDAAAEHQFCCHGCKTVYAVIHQCGMDRYYQLRDAAEPATGPARVTGKAYREYDDAAFLELHAPALPNGLRAIDLYLEGVHCAACVWLVEKIPTVLRGVVEARLDMGKALVRITWDDHAVALSRIATMLDSLGYPPHPARSATARQIRTRTDRRFLVHIGVAGACAGNAMLLATALYAGLFAHMENGYTLLFRVLSMILGLIALFWPGWTFFRGAWAAIRTRTPHLDIPIALGIGAGSVAGVINTILNRGEIYFDSITVLIFLLLVGRFLQHRQQATSEDAVELLFSLTPTSARRVNADGTIAEVPIAALQVEDTVEVLAGESVPVDGQIAQGRSSVDQSLLTGEAEPKAVADGDTVCAGTVNVAAPLRVTVLATGESTRVGKLMKLVADCARRKAPIVLKADRIAGVFLIAVLALTAITFAAWWMIDPRHAVEHAVALLIVACPCALGLATPLAVSVALGRAARRDLLIKGGDTLERLTRPGMLFLDKTGTITTGKTEMIEYTGDSSAQPYVRAIEAAATHPIARAFVRALPEAIAPTPADVQQDPHGGIVGTFPQGRYAIGARRFIIARGIAVPEWAEARHAAIAAEGHTPVLIARDSEVVAIAAFGHAIRPDVLAALAKLRAAGWTVGILSGDHPEVVAKIGQTLGIDPALTQGGLLPEQKLEIVNAHLREGGTPRTVVMVGDGVNDAAALAAASVGIAVHGGAEASLAAASVYMNRPGILPIVELLGASKRTVSVIHRAMLASLLYNAFSVSLAAFGLINPLVAAVLMPISSITVLTLAFTARTFPKEPVGGSPCP